MHSLLLCTPLGGDIREYEQGKMRNFGAKSKNEENEDDFLNFYSHH